MTAAEAAGGEAKLWTARELAAFLGLSQESVQRMASSKPDRLPPRVAGLGRQRWVPDVCRRWALENSVPTGQPRKPGRPRRRPEAA